MLLLTGTSDQIKIVTDAAVPVDVHASYVDYDGTADVDPERLNTAISTATTTTVVGSPGSGVQRNVKKLFVKNIHASSPVLVTVQHTDGTILVELYEVTLPAGWKLSFVEDEGFELLDANGVVQ